MCGLIVTSFSFECCLLLDWIDGSVKSYYTGNDFILMSQSSNATIKRMSAYSRTFTVVLRPSHCNRYNDLCKFVNGRYAL
jgi:hypothetical protein